MSGLARRLERGAGARIEEQLSHPFVRGLGDGTLPPEMFARWVRQDYLYLVGYARTFSLLSARSDRLASMRWHAAVATLTLDTEMELHRGYAARFGIGPEELEREPLWPTTRAYTDFLVRTAALGEAVEGVAAVLPCAWGYLEVASALDRAGRPEDDRYADWIGMYTSGEFREATRWLEDELDRLGEGIGPAAEERASRAFTVSLAYELAFWEMCWRGEAPVAPPHRGD